MRNPVWILKSLEEKACDRDYRYERLYRNLYNPDFYLLAYQNIAKSQGSMTPGADGMTLDGMDEARINRIIASLKDHSYKPNPARREYIAKKNSTKKRPLGIPSTDDKLVQEIIRMILEAIYEPGFSKHSHGFRPKRSCHTALSEIQNTFTGVKWMIEGDIKACFDCFDHHVLIELLRRRIHDEYFISLMWKFLKAGYMEQWIYHTTYSGTPQGSGMSPILANIYLSELDNFMEQYKVKFDVGGKDRRETKEYSRINGTHERLRKKYRRLKDTLPVEERKALAKQLRSVQLQKLQTPLYPVKDDAYKRLQYNRYADDFVVGIIGSKEDAEKVKADIKLFLQDSLKLTLSEEKTKITHSTEKIRYLGYDICVLRDMSFTRTANGQLQRLWNGRVKLTMPHEKWFNKLLEYRTIRILKDENGRERWRTLHRGNLTSRPDIEIISKFNSEIRGIYNFYRMAQNVSTLDKFYNIMKSSMLKTFANKYRTTVNKIKKAYIKDGIFGVDYQTKEGEKRCELYHDGFTRKKDDMLAYVDILPQYKKYDKPNSLAGRLNSKTCELCGDKSEHLIMHHVKWLKDLSESIPSEKLMMEKRRKSLALCAECFKKVQARIL
ncbi:reverse transcriptase/maturase family protein [Dehalobacter restrictus]|uniref:Group II intron reverse transcriptase/maturase n=1 Tax=Dehalobacter restrictus TaxID=55583 RepID=A0A857DKW6_9FIRM|nr:reverse transcriptase/maturase family protein [Dehalobacter restrictus]QHA01079.1 group II intron reverse transcriptase/maturase [Dehalobacter restrictus]